MYNIFPKLKKQQMLEGKCDIQNCVIYFDKNFENACHELKSFLKYRKGSKKQSNLSFIQNDELSKEGYIIDVLDESIKVQASTYSGFYYSVKTLKQMLGCGKHSEIKLDKVHIEDEPDLEIRGFMYDISRNKVPKLETIKYVVDIMSDLKMNHLELYVEGFSFEYKSFKEYLKKDAYITIEEFLELKEYCKLKAVDLVGNENGFGHMGKWLEKKELTHLAEKEDGIFLWGSHRGPSTLNPLDEESFEFVKKLYEDMIPYTDSEYFNMNFDEPFELGLGKSKEECDKIGVDEVYKKFAKKCGEEIINKYGKKPMIWGDVLVRHGASLDNLPKDMIYLDWGYDAEYPFDQHLAILKKANVPFVSAPGTSTWCGWFGRLYDWQENIGNAIWANYKLGGMGVILTDWGDFGHPQHLPSTLAPLTYAGLLSYRCQAGTFKKVREFLNKFVYKDPNNLVADVIMDSGGYNQYEKGWRGNGTIAWATLYFAVNALKETDEPVSYFQNVMQHSIYNKENYVLLCNYLEGKIKEYKLVIKDKLVRKEMISTASLVLTFAHLNYAYNKDEKDKIKYLEKAQKGLEKYVSELPDIWLARNKYSDLDDTLEMFGKVLKFIQISVEHFKGGTNEA